MLILSPRQQGFSLVELLVGLAIVAILLALGVPSFSAFMQNSQIRNAAESIQNGVNLARAEAVRRNANVQFVLGSGSSWEVTCVTPLAGAVVGAPDCPGAGTLPSYIQSRPSSEGSRNATVVATEVVATDNSAATTPVFIATLAFNGLGRVITNPGLPGYSLPLGNNAVFDVANPTAGICRAIPSGTVQCLRVIVSSAGQVRICDPSRATPDPQAC